MVDQDREILGHQNLQNMFHLPKNGNFLEFLWRIIYESFSIVKQERRSRSSSKPSRSKSPKKSVKQKSKKDAKKKSKRKRKSSTSSSSNSSSDSEIESKQPRKELFNKSYSFGAGAKSCCVHDFRRVKTILKGRGLTSKKSWNHKILLKTIFWLKTWGYCQHKKETSRIEHSNGIEFIDTDMTFKVFIRFTDIFTDISILLMSYDY